RSGLRRRGQDLALVLGLAGSAVLGLDPGRGRLADVGGMAEGLGDGAHGLGGAGGLGGPLGTVGLRDAPGRAVPLAGRVAVALGRRARVAAVITLAETLVGLGQLLVGLAAPRLAGHLGRRRQVVVGPVVQRRVAGVLDRPGQVVRDHGVFMGELGI